MALLGGSFGAGAGASADDRPNASGDEAASSELGLGNPAHAAIHSPILNSVVGFGTLLPSSMAVSEIVSFLPSAMLNSLLLRRNCWRIDGSTYLLGRSPTQRKGRKTGDTKYLGWERASESRPAVHLARAGHSTSATGQHAVRGSY